MLAKRLLSHILDNEALTRGLGDPEARLLVEWLVERAENLAAVQDNQGGDGGPGDAAVVAQVERLCRRARAVGRFVALWCTRGGRGAAVQLAATERFYWPLPTSAVDPCELMQTILDWEASHPMPDPATTSRRQAAS
jgi:hypothetical protein